MSEHEQAPTQNEIRDPRPIGRFLLGFEDYSEMKDPYVFAKEFANRPGNFEKHKHKSLRIEEISDLTIDGRGVWLEFMIDRFSYVWKITIAAEQRKTEDISTNYNSHGGEQYELHCSVAKITGNYREYSNQGGVVRQRQIESDDNLRALQGLVEQLVERQ